MGVRILRSYRIVSTDAILVLARLVPQTLLTKERRRKFAERNANPMDIREDILTEWQR